MARISKKISGNLADAVKEAQSKISKKSEKDSQDNSLFEAFDIHEESQKEEVEDNRPEWEKRNAKNHDEFCEWELEKAKLNGLENPDFDFRNFYEKGQIVYYIHILQGGINTKELKKLKIRTIYPRMMVCDEEKSCCQCIWYGAKDLVFDALKDANTVYKIINLADEKELEKAKSGKKSNNDTVEYPNEENSEYEAHMSLEEAMANNEED